MSRVMSDMKDGGSAFPANVQFVQKGPTVDEESKEYLRDFMKANGGMTLRDWFAGQALAGLLAKDWYSATRAAEGAYGIADAMLKMRKVEFKD